MQGRGADKSNPVRTCFVIDTTAATPKRGYTVWDTYSPQVRKEYGGSGEGGMSLLLLTDNRQ